MTRLWNILLVAAAAILPTGAAQAQDDGWHFTLQPYLMVPAMNGNTAIRGFDATVDISPKTVIDQLNIGFMGYLEAAKGDWAFGVDVNYANLDATKDEQRTSANLTQVVVQPMVFYRVNPNLEVMGGARYNSLKIGLASQIPVIDGAERKKDWVDPIVGMRITTPLSNSTTISVQANIGGFGTGSDISVQFRPMVNFKIASHTTLDVGYQFFYQKYENGSGTDRFLYDVLANGPILGVTFKF
jgi:hypothetical protein